MKQLISGARIFDGDKLLSEQAIVLNGSVVEAIVPIAEADTSLPHIQLDGGIVAPGFIDLQVNGGGGVLLNNATQPETLLTMLNAHRSKGVTAILPTLVSDTLATLDQGIDAARTLIKAATPGILGIHIEGPFFNPERRGVHSKEQIRPLTAADIDWLCSNADIPMMLTLAPEQTQPGQIKTLTEAGIVVCAGHTNATGSEVEAALAEGLQGFTHLFNAMRPMASREPGVVGTALADKPSYCGIIVDGHHVHANSVLVAHKAKAAGKLYLVSDAMATIGSPEKTFELYGETIYEQDGCLKNSEGKLAGSAIGLMDAVRISHREVGLELEECLRMASLYPAQFFNLEQSCGRIKPGYAANLVHFTDALTVCSTWLEGARLQHTEVSHS
ncbi:N-acetylglucosamine-6-phosphate deacetylase [Oceanicoccus sagamiensis]|uniref:N-acetylglucosamine-6-phosphate deacetylase n=2 Tax=Oceanicoccus sagamiensis TaxID=716816 RepID=A0A1X9NF90_9GAMM|nr:N-acetylglucosamine-6-phosphate deacetylase [Oceanicoccus sagamiensis]